MKLTKISSNFHRVDLNELTIYFSYETPVAVYHEAEGLTISKNEWRNTTGKHLNSICRDKSIRVDHKEVLKRIEAYIV